MNYLVFLSLIRSLAHSLTRSRCLSEEMADRIAIVIDDDDLNIMTTDRVRCCEDE